MKEKQKKKKGSGSENVFSLADKGIRIRKGTHDVLSERSDTVEAQHGSLVLCGGESEEEDTGKERSDRHGATTASTGELDEPRSNDTTGHTAHADDGVLWSMSEERNERSAAALSYAYNRHICFREHGTHVPVGGVGAA